MKKFLFAFLLVILAFDKSWGVACSMGACYYGNTPNPIMLDCESAVSLGCTEGGAGEEIFSCLSCYSGSTRTRITNSDAGCSVSYYVCDTPCTGCSGCTDVDWASSGVGYQMYKEAFCNCNTCEYSLYFRCAGNYYGTSNALGTSGCSVCPSGGSSTAGSNSLITNCFYGAGSGGENTFGSYTYTQACYYTN